MSSRPKSATVARPVARYRRGVVPANAGNQSESSDEGEGEQDLEGEEDTRTGEDDRVDAQSTRKQMAVTLKEVQVDELGVVRIGGKGEVGRTAREIQDEQEQGASDCVRYHPQHWR